MTDTAENDDFGPCPTPGEIRVFDGQRCRFIERELEGDKWVVLGPASMTDTVCVPVEPTEAVLDAACYHGPDTPAGRFDYSDARTVRPAVMLAASPQGEADWITHDGGPNPVPGKMVECKLAGTSFRMAALPSECLNWAADLPFGGSIIAYRVTEGVKP